MKRACDWFGVATMLMGAAMVVIFTAGGLLGLLLMGWRFLVTEAMR